MESSNKTCNDQEKKKMAIKIDGGVGGIGAVILLGGALATAALASAFLVRVKGRSSIKDRRRRYQNPPPEDGKDNEEYEENKGQEIVFTDRQPSHVFEHPSKEAIKEVVLENDNTEAFLVPAPTSTLDEKDKIEINGGTPGEIEASYHILCPDSLKKLEKDAVSDDGLIVDENFPLLEEKSSLDSQDKMPEGENLELTKENVSIDYSKENTNVEKVNVEREEEGEREKNDDGGVEVMSCKEGVKVSETQPKEEEKQVEGARIDQKKVEERENMELNMEREVVEGLCIDDGEISEKMKCLDAIEIAKMDLSKDVSSQEVNPVSEIVVSESHSEKEEEEEVKALLPEFESGVVELENVAGNEKKSVQEDEANDESREDEAKYIKKLVEEEDEEEEENEECEQTEKGIVPRKRDELSDLIEGKEENIIIPHENKEEKALLPEFESVVEHENLDGDENKSVQEDEADDESREDEAKYVEKSIKEEEDQTEEGIVPRKCDELSDMIEDKEEKIVQMIEELIHEVTKEDAANEDIIVSQEKFEKNEIKQVLLSPEYVEITKDDCNNEVLDKNTEKDAEEEVIHHVSIEAAKDDIMYNESDESTEESENKGSDDDEIVEASSVETSESSTESNSDAVWPAESPKRKLFDHELEGKIQEDMTVKEGEKVFTSEKIFTNKFMVKNHVTNSSKRRMVIGMLSLVSSLSCSWLFGLSFVKLCIVVFLTMVVSEIHGY